MVSRGIGLHRGDLVTIGVRANEGVEGVESVVGDAAEGERGGGAGGAGGLDEGEGVGHSGWKWKLT